MYIDRCNCKNQISNEIKGIFIPKKENIHSYVHAITVKLQVAGRIYLSDAFSQN